MHPVGRFQCLPHTITHMAIVNPHTTQEDIQNTSDRRSLLNPELKMRVQFLGANSVKERWEGVTLPAYDYSLDTCDRAFPLSVGKCWQNIPDPNYPKHFIPAAWAVPFWCYTFLGDVNEHFISPSNKSVMLGKEDLTSDDIADAFNDISKIIRFDKKLSAAEKDYYFKKPDRTSDARIPTRQMKFFSFNNYTTKDTRSKPVTELIAYSGGAQDHNVEQMRWHRDDNVAVLDPRYPRYLLGDPTRPEAALVWSVDKRMLDPKDPQETNVFIWSQQREILDSPVVTRVITEEMLSKRFLLIDPANWNFPSYQEMVDFAVNHLPGIPIELIKEGCGHRADVGERRHIPRAPKNDRRDSREAADDDYNPMNSARNRQEEEPASPQRTFAPTPPPIDPATAAAPAPTPVVTPPADTATYLVAPPGGAPSSMTVSQLIAAVAVDKALFVLIDNAWVMAVDSPLVPKAPVVPAVPSVPTVPTVPAVPSVPTVPAAATPTTAAPQYDLVTVRRQMVSDERYATLSAAGLAEVEAVAAAVFTQRSAGARLAVELMERVATISDENYRG